MAAGPFRIALVTAPNMKTAERIAVDLVDNKLAACVNCVPGLISHYRWKGKRMRDREVLLVIKTRAPLFKRLEAAVKAVHPYDVPEIIGIPVLEGHAPYLQWLGAQTGR